MLRIEEYCQSIQSESTRAGMDIFDFFRSNGLIDPHDKHKDVEKLVSADLMNYVVKRKQMLKQYRKEWYEIIAKEIRFKRPFIANGQYLASMLNNHTEPLYVFPCFMKPGRQNYVVIQEDDLANQPTYEALPTDEDAYFIHKCIVENRVEEVPVYTKPMKMGKKERKFKHEKSIWATWKKDTS